MKRIIYKYIYMVLLHGVLITSSYSQNTYTLDECRRLALENNVKIRNATNTVKIAEQENKEAFTKYFPNISASGIAFDTNNGLMEMDILPGMNMSLLKDGMAGGITLVQPLFAGGKIVNGNRLAKTGLEISKLQQKQTEKEVLLTVEKYYWQIVMLQAKLETLRSAEKTLEHICNDAESAVSAGITTRNDLLQAQLQKNDIESNRINLEKNLSISQMILTQYIGVPIGEIELESFISTEKIPEFPHHLKQNHTEAISRTPEYQLLSNNLKVNRLQQKMTIGKQLPTVSLGVGYMYHDFLDKSHSFVAGLVSVSIPLSGWWEGSHEIKKQKLQIKNTENLLADHSEMLVISMQKAWNDLQEAYEQIVVAHKSIEQANENLHLNENYYRAGTCTMSDLLNSQTMYQQSCDKYIDAYATFQIKITEYSQMAGIL